MAANNSINLTAGAVLFFKFSGLQKSVPRNLRQVMLNVLKEGN